MKNKKSLPFWRLYCTTTGTVVTQLKVLLKTENSVRRNTTATKAWTGVTLSTDLYPQLDIEVLKVCIGNLLGFCDIKVIFPQVCSPVFMTSPNVWHHNRLSAEANMRIHLSPPSKPDTKEIFKKYKTMPLFLLSIFPLENIILFHKMYYFLCS